MSSTAKTLDLITLGESMIRFSPPGSERLETARQLDVHLGGAEGNIAVGLARLGKRTALWTRLPDNPLGRQVVSILRGQGVDMSGVCWGSGRMGTYFVEFGAPPRATQVIYDRANSAASQMQPGDFDWSQLAAAKWLHLTGITPALSDSCRETVLHAIAEARQAGLFISFDFNYRTRLWTPEQAAPVLDELAGKASLVIAAERDLKALFGLENPDLRALRARWNGADVVVTRSSSGASGIDQTGLYHADSIPVTNPIAIGTGDAFDSGLFYCLMQGQPLAEALRYGCAMAALKLTIPGDLALVTRDEVETLLRNQSGGVQR